ncbi:acyl-CoA thioesterase II [Pseudonocardia halophobica]|uniref:Acyl-CoA thioesterase II n=1 Tax=Pseudonocardia halophobica TaxID=29401 RepID=A0A9W6NYW7_9PSEU|nr:acyl-CoA thioesterase domain-containing protein [Pseudonocardia halophobica]GLL14950.1 acyl-CoA thioesterase II [Pseudonocardia halophobica]
MTELEIAPGATAVGTLLDVHPTGPDRYEAAGQEGLVERGFGGVVVGRALRAAGSSVGPDRPVHSIHGHFLRPADAAAATRFHVTPVRDGATVSLRQVVAEQHGKEIFLLTASFEVPQDGWAHQVPRLTTGVTDPADLPTPLEQVAGADETVRSWWTRLDRLHPVDLRFEGELPRSAAHRGEAAPPHHRFWVRTREPLPADPLFHHCVVAYASDMMLLSTALAPHATMFGAPDVTAASLDHAVWFHGAVRADDWLCYEQDSSWAADGRALCHGRFFARSGRLVATVAQEAIVRRRAG